MTRLVVLACVVAAALAPAGSSTAGSPAPDLTVSADRARLSTRIGRDFTFATRIVNHSSSPTASLVAHVNILSLQPDVYLDPEDWSSRRTRYLGTIAAGGSRRITWKLKAVTRGDAAIFVSVLPQQGGPRPPVNSPTLHVAIAEHRTLNSGGILPLAAGIPAFLGLVTVAARLRRRRR